MTRTIRLPTKHLKQPKTVTIVSLIYIPPLSPPNLFFSPLVSHAPLLLPPSLTTYHQPSTITTNFRPKWTASPKSWRRPFPALGTESRSLSLETGQRSSGIRPGTLVSSRRSTVRWTGRLRSSTSCVWMGRIWGKIIWGLGGGCDFHPVLHPFLSFLLPFVFFTWQMSWLVDRMKANFDPREYDTEIGIPPLKSDVNREFSNIEMWSNLDRVIKYAVR